MSARYGLMADRSRAGGTDAEYPIKLSMDSRFRGNDGFPANE
jgi:hypothetical protein